MLLPVIYRNGINFTGADDLPCAIRIYFPDFYRYLCTNNRLYEKCH